MSAGSGHGDRRLHAFLYSCTNKSVRGGEQFVAEHALSYVVSGSMTLYTPDRSIECPAGTLGLVKRNQLLKSVKNPAANGAPFRSVNVLLDQETLRRFAAKNGFRADAPYSGDTFVDLSGSPFLPGFFASILPFETRPEQLTPRLAELKTSEAIELLLRHDPAMRNLLFDFSEPFKIDLEAFMRQSFTFNIPLSRFAQLSGRSLSGFKRDFRAIFRGPPERWLLETRLEHAHFLIKEKDMKPSEVYSHVGFGNFSHFSTAFKARYGYTAASLRKNKDSSGT